MYGSLVVSSGLLTPHNRLPERTFARLGMSLCQLPHSVAYLYQQREVPKYRYYLCCRYWE